MQISFHVNGIFKTNDILNYYGSRMWNWITDAFYRVYTRTMLHILREMHNLARSFFNNVSTLKLSVIHAWVKPSTDSEHFRLHNFNHKRPESFSGAFLFSLPQQSIISDQSSMVRFEPVAHGQIENLLNIWPRNRLKSKPLYGVSLKQVLISRLYLTFIEIFFYLFF